MNLLDYIQGIRKGRDANRIEKDALRDAFTFEALEGYDSVKGNHAANINKLQKRIHLRNKQSNDNNLFVRVASIVAIIIFGIGGYMVYDLSNPNSTSQSLSAMDSKKAVTIINIFVPDDFYKEHKASIKKNNYQAKKKYLSVNITPFNIEEEITAKVSKQEISELSKLRNKSIIDIYIPDNDYQLNEIEIAKGNNRAQIISEESGSNTIDIYIPSEEYNKQNRDSNLK